MLDISKYEVLEKLFEDSEEGIYRLLDKEYNKSVLLKVYKKEGCYNEQYKKIKNEYEILKNINIDGAIKVYGIEGYQQSPAIVLEDFKGLILKEIICKTTINMEDFLIIAIELVSIIEELNKNHIIHKNISSKNIMVNMTNKEVKLTGFQKASLSVENNHDGIISKENYAYISPEQTGRMNRAVDYRSDFYSLGVVFYEMLTGRLPFQCEDSLELMHCHIAKKPITPHNINKTIPNMISTVVMKLLSKNVEDRYKSASSIKLDLEECLTQWRKYGNIKRFQLARKESIEILNVSSSIYGRENEIRELINLLDEVNNGAKRTVMVFGEAGVGKSTLISELPKYTTIQKGYFICSKFDQFNKSKPYAGFIEAYKELIHQILMDKEENIKVWKNELCKALEDYLQVVIEVIPEFEYIIGKEYSVTQMKTMDTVNMFSRIFLEILNVFSKRECPIIIFFDDLQWADEASLKLLSELISNYENGYLLIVGAFRTDDGVKELPLMKVLKDVSVTDENIKCMYIGNLSLEDIIKIVSHSLLWTWEKCLNLSEILMKKTGGNPLFLKQFLKSLCEENILFYDDNKKSWMYDLNNIESMQITDNVVDLVITRIKKLNPNAQHLLILAAFLGNKFKLSSLSIIFENTPVITAVELNEVINEGLIVPIKGNTIILSEDNNSIEDNKNVDVTYRFTHDRIQQAAYHILDNDERERVHYKVGTLLLDKFNTEEDEDSIFKIVNHLNSAEKVIVNAVERIRAAELNLAAGRKANRISEDKSALDYFDGGIKFLPRNKWSKHHQLTFQLYKESAEYKVFNGYYELCKQELYALLSHCENRFEKARVYYGLIDCYSCLGDKKKAAEYVLESLRMFNIYIQPNISRRAVKEKVDNICTILEKRKTSSLIDLPEMIDEEKKIVMDVLAEGIIVLGSINETNAENLLSSVLCEMVSISLEYGNAPSSVEGYMCFALILPSLFGRITEAQDLGKLSYTLINKREYDYLSQAKINYYYGSNIVYLRSSLSSGIQYLLEAEKYAIKCGAVNTISAIYVQLVTSYLICGFNLKDILNTCSESLKKQNKINKTYTNEILVGIKYLVTKLVGKTSDVVQRVEEENKIAQIESSEISLVIFFYNTYKMLVCYILEEYDEALEAAKKAEKVIWIVAASKHLSMYYFYYSLILAALYKEASLEDRKNYLKTIKLNQKELKIWSEVSPHNFYNLYLIVEAQLAVLKNDGRKAVKLFEEALEAARKNDFIQNAAICSELMAISLLNDGLDTIGKMYLETSSSYYEKWGALEKVKLLNKRYPKFLSFKIKDEADVNELVAATSENAYQLIDMNAVIKASQAISGEIIFDKLIERILKIAVENAGAQKGYFIIELEEGLVINAHWGTDNLEGAVGSNIPIEESNDVSKGIVYYAARTKQNIVLDDAANEGMFISDSYVIRKEPKSIMCIPIIHVGKIKGILYLENNLTTKAFTYESVEILKIFASQAAISIENASMYKRIKKLNEELEVQVEKRTKELKETVEKLKLEITERKEIEAAFKENEERLSTLINSMPDVVGFKDSEGRWLEVNQAALDLLDIKREDYVGKTFLDMANNFSQYKDVFLNCDRTEEIAWVKGEIYQEEENIPKPDGTERTFEVIKVPLYYENGERKGMVLIARDITIRKKAEDKLKESEERYRCLIDLIPDAIRVNMDGKIVLTNKATNRDFGVENSEDLIGRHMLDYLIPHPEYEEQFKKNKGITHRKKKIASIEEKFIRKCDGQILDRETVITKIPYNGKEAFLVVARDISERKRAEELHRKMEESDKRLKETVEYDKIKTEFFANISHELRTPLNVILGTVQVSNLLLGDGEGCNNFIYKDKFKKYIHVMRQNCFRLVRLVNNLIDITKIDAGYFQMSWSNCNIINVVEDIALSIAEYIENKGIELIFDTEVEEKIMACDPDKIERIILNLISNAVKFTEPGGNIQVSIFDRNEYIMISVKDTGIGIPQEKQKQIFERFVQVDKSLARISEGSGIGLSLVKSLVEMHGGNINLISEVGKGSEFLVKLPVKVLEQDKNIENNSLQQGNIEKIQIEFSDVYL